jgi:hypothetical protein
VGLVPKGSRKGNVSGIKKKTKKGKGETKMLGYSNYWTAGFSANQWYEITHHKEFGWAEFYLIHIGAGYDNHSQDWEFEFYLLGLRFWLMIADPWGKHPSDLENALEEFRGTNPELFKAKNDTMAPKTVDRP